MLSSSKLHSLGMEKRIPVTMITMVKPAMGRSASGGSPVVAAAAAGSTTWDFWSGSIAKRKAPERSGQVADISKEVAASIASAATTFKAKHTSVDQSATFKWSQVEVKESKALPADLHDKLELLGLEALKGQCGLKDGAKLEVATVSFTTSDLDAGISATGLIYQQGGDKTAYIALVATETSRQASWSRLEGLLLHWAVSDRQGGSWNLPPQGWTAVPNKVIDAGSAVECMFEKKRPQGQEPVYVLVLTLPITGVLKNGGLTFVLKATAGQNTRWLQDASTSKDFYVNIGSFPVVKA